MQVDNISSILKFYETFVDSSLASKIVEEKNMLNSASNLSIAKKFSNNEFWEETTLEEIYFSL